MFDHNANVIHAMCSGGIPAERPTPKVIVPTIGRPLWFWRSGLLRLLAQSDPTVQPEAATVTYVHNERSVNLQVLDGHGKARIELVTELTQPEDPWGEETGPHAQWTPYQVGQAAKTEAAERHLASEASRAPQTNLERIQAHAELMREAQLRVADIGVDANGSPVTEAEQLSRDLTDAPRDEAVGG